MRYAAWVEYQGAPYYGWQRQEQVASVQAELEAALSKVADHAIEVVCAGRTDKGVHACGQVVHFDSDSARSLRAWTLGVNTHLSAHCRVREVRPVDDAFHARYSARYRAYRYLLYVDPVRSALWDGCATWQKYPLDVAKMHQSAQALLGEHDFSAFRAAECQALHPRRCLQAIEVTQEGRWIVVYVRANAFLHHMVRNIVGVLLTVGQGKSAVEHPAQVLQARTRCHGGITAPAQGLYFCEAGYDEPLFGDCKPWILP